MLFGVDGDSKQLLEVLVKAATGAGFPPDYITVIPTAGTVAHYQWPEGHSFGRKDTDVHEYNPQEWTNYRD